MATLDPKPYPFPKFDPKNWKASYAKQDKALAAIPESRIRRFGVGDGYAIYYVKSVKPFVLQHVPFGDSYTIHPALLRGLRASDR